MKHRKRITFLYYRKRCFLNFVIEIHSQNELEF